MKLPLKTVCRGHTEREIDIDDAEGFTVLTNVHIENARRIVASVNLLAQYPIELLQGALEYDAAPGNAYWEPPHPIFNLAKHRDDLVAENKRLRDGLTKIMQLSPNFPATREIAEQALKP